MDIPENADNLGTCPNSSQYKALRQFRRNGLWDYRAELKTRLDSPIKFTPSISAPKRADNTVNNIETDAKEVDKEALIF